MAQLRSPAYIPSIHTTEGPHLLHYHRFVLSLPEGKPTVITSARTAEVVRQFVTRKLFEFLRTPCAQSQRFPLGIIPDSHTRLSVHVHHILRLQHLVLLDLALPSGFAAGWLLQRGSLQFEKAVVSGFLRIRTIAKPLNFSLLQLARQGR